MISIHKLAVSHFPLFWTIGGELTNKTSFRKRKKIRRTAFHQSAPRYSHTRKDFTYALELLFLLLLLMLMMMAESCVPGKAAPWGFLSGLHAHFNFTSLHFGLTFRIEESGHGEIFFSAEPSPPAFYSGIYPMEPLFDWLSLRTSMFRDASSLKGHFCRFTVSRPITMLPFDPNCTAQALSILEISACFSSHAMWTWTVQTKITVPSSDCIGTSR